MAVDREEQPQEQETAGRDVAGAEETTTTQVEVKTCLLYTSPSPRD